MRRFRVLVAVVVTACGNASAPPSANEVAPKAVSAETRIDAGSRLDASAPSATLPAAGDDEPACDPDDPRCTAPLEMGKAHPRAHLDAGSPPDDSSNGAR
jgi:hypothetical protein